MPRSTEQSGLVFHQLMAYYIMDFNLDATISVESAQNDDSEDKLYLLSFEFQNVCFELWFNRRQLVNYPHVICKLNQHDYMVHKERTFEWD